MPEPNNFPRANPENQPPVFPTPFWDFHYDTTVRFDGSSGNYSWVKTHSGRGAVMAVPVTPSEQYLLIKVYRYPVQKYMWEFPAGLIDGDESPSEAARREMIEETGVEPTHIELLGSQTPVAGLVGDEFYTVLTHIPEIEMNDLTLQAEESIVEAKLITRSEIVAMVTGQEIEDGVTLYSLARYWAWQEANEGLRSEAK